MRRNQNGFTLVEIAIVLVIIGLLLGGILKGQELITSAKVRNVADGMAAQRAAVQAFFDRYQALPGDYSAGVANIPNVVAASDGNGNGIIDGIEGVVAWHHLTQAGFLNGCQACVAPALPAGVLPSAANSPVNSYGGVEGFATDTGYLGGVGGAAPAIPGPAAVTQIKSGSQVPSNIIAEVDRKMDDGNPGTGSLRFSNFNGGPGGVAPTNAGAASCVAAPNWAAGAQIPNCGAALLLN